MIAVAVAQHAFPAQVDEELAEACGPDPSWFCEAGWNLFGTRAAARAMDWLITKPLVAILVLVIAALLNRWLRRGVTTLVTQFTRHDRGAGAALGKLALSSPADDTGYERDKLRAATLSSVARTTVSAFIWSAAVLVILGIFEINLAPLLASAGIAALAVGLGAQQLVKDCISGFFILLEDQCAVGDEIDIGPAIGTVEAITLRATTVRDNTGTLWTVPNGTVLRIGNKSRGWAQGSVDVTVANPAQLDDAVAVIERVAGEVSALPDVVPLLLAPIAVPGVESLGTDGTVVRVTVRTAAGEHGRVLRTLRAALTRGLDAAGIGSTT
jgi:moderate conductance mechanosensitive channel